MCDHYGSQRREHIWRDGDIRRRQTGGVARGPGRSSSRLAAESARHVDRGNPLPSLWRCHSLMSRKAFTLIELLVVIAIIAILAAILFPVFAQAKAQAKKAADLSNNKQANMASQIYLNDSDDLYPLEAGQDSTGAWRYGLRLLIPPTWTLSTDARVQASYGLAHNTIQPYVKNNALMLS